MWMCLAQGGVGGEGCECTQCSILLHLIGICFLTQYLWQCNLHSSLAHPCLSSTTCRLCGLQTKYLALCSSKPDFVGFLNVYLSF